MTSSTIRDAQLSQRARNFEVRSGPVLPVAVGRLLIGITFAGVCAGVLWSMTSGQGQYFLFGMMACLVVTIPVARPGYAVLGPWSLLVIVVYISCGVRGLFIGLQLDGRNSIDSLFLLGHGPGYFFRSSLLYVIALALAAIGYMWRPRRPAGAVIRTLSPFEFPRMMGVVTVILAVVGLIAFVLYAQRTGGLTGGLSAKRTTINGVELAKTYRSYGELRFINTFSSIALWLHVARQAVTAKRGIVGPRLFTWALLANAALLPVYASSRGEVAFLALVALAIHYGVLGTLPRGRVILRSAVLSLLVLALMTGARAASQGNQGASVVSRQAITDSVGEVLVYNRNFGDMQTTAHIIHAVPTLLPFEHGDTILAWLAGPIPRAMWPGKPLIQSGPIIGATVYGNERSGVPPGFVAEMYWNFALPGVLLGSLLLGLVMAWARDAFLPYVRGKPIVATIYAVVIMRLGAYVFTGGVGSGIFKLLSDLVCLVIGLALVRACSSGRRSGAADQARRTT